MARFNKNQWFKYVVSLTYIYGERDLGSSVTLSDIILHNNFYMINILKISLLYYIFFNVFNIHAKFHANQMLFTLRFIYHLLCMVIRYKNLKFKIL